MASADSRRATRAGAMLRSSTDGSDEGRRRDGAGHRANFAPLARYRYLPADYPQALNGGSLDYLVNRLALLARKPNGYVARPRAAARQRQRQLSAANLMSLPRKVCA